VVKDKAVTYKMGSGKRETFVAKTAREMPGPGNYNNDSSEFGKTGKQFTFGGK
jgi:hypothetical protein